MDNMTIKLECLRLAEGNIARAAEMFNFVKAAVYYAAPKVGDTYTVGKVPVAFTLKEGDVWTPWDASMRRGSVFAVMFDDGSIFDAVAGWR